MVESKEHKITEENKKLSERKAYLLDKDLNISKMGTILTKIENYWDNLEVKLNELERKNKQLKQQCEEYKIEAQSKGRVVSQELKYKLIAYHANEKIKQI